MRFFFDYYKNLERIDLYLCNPDEKELFVIPGKERIFTLRFNDISEFSFKVDDKFTDRNGNSVPLEVYEYIRTKRLVYVTNIGWFKIVQVDETDDGITKQKNVVAESYQSVFKDRGFLSEERVYCFYNSVDPYDDRYTASNEGHVPSVVGQLNKQLGIKVNLAQGLEEPNSAYEDWTITYISEDVKELHRTFKANTTYGYDFMVNDVENAFKVVFVFDFLYKTIQVKTINEVTENRSGVIYTFNNFMKSVSVAEKADDIVTVLNCNGGNCDITLVNPTGTNYICDFSYYMDESEHRWMSQALIDKIKTWKDLCEASQADYMAAIARYRDALRAKLDYETQLKYESTYLTDLKNAHDNRSILKEGEVEGGICGYVRAEAVQAGNYSLDANSTYESIRFDGSSHIVAYKDAPVCTETSPGSGIYRWTFGGSSRQGTADEIVAGNMADENNQYWYFDDTNGTSYCKLTSRAVLNTESQETQYVCKGFDRFIAMRYPVTKTQSVSGGEGIDGSVKQVAYVDSIQTWIDTHESKVFDLNDGIARAEAEIKQANDASKQISERLNIISYFADTPDLFRELTCYWIEGSYDDENISILEGTTPEEEVELCLALLEAGKVELAKVSQPRFSFSLEAIDVSKNPEFQKQMAEIEVGKLITIEKEEGLWYYPVLLELVMNLDELDDFKMSYANALRLDDWGYTYADLIKSASSTSRQVNANWQDIMKYSKERAEVQSIIKDPLNLTLRAAYANMTNQEFTINTSGILGRKKVSENSSEFEPQQVRLINNVLLFTDDNWSTVKTALGKIYYPDPDDPSKILSKYGLAAEVLIGDLFLGSKLHIRNEDSSIILDKKGFTIKRVPGTGNDEDDVIFRVDTSGNLTLKGFVKSSELGISMTAILSHVAENYATNSMLAKVSSNTSTAIALFRQEVSDTYVTSEMVAEIVDGPTGALTKFKQEVTNTYAKTTTVNEFKGKLSESIAKVEAIANGNTAAIENLTKITGPDGTVSLANVLQIATEHESKISQLTEWKDTTTTSIAEIEEKANENGASISMVVDHNGIRGGMLISAINGESFAKISADRLEIEGQLLNIRVPSVNIEGKLMAHQIGTVAGWTIAGGDMYCGTAYDFFPPADNLYTGTTGNGIRLSTNSGIGDGAIGGISIGCCTVPATEVYDSTYHQQFIFGGKHIFRSRWSAQCYGINIEARGIYFYNATDDVPVSGARAENYIANVSGGVKLFGTWQSGSCLGTGSARTLKNSIENLDSRHSVLFDNLIPRSFKYNDGSSQRVHYGLIVDELKNAMDEAGITSSECAAYCLDDKNEPMGGGAIRYSELIPLCIREIQLLKRELASLKT